MREEETESNLKESGEEVLKYKEWVPHVRRSVRTLEHLKIRQNGEEVTEFK